MNKESESRLYSQSALTIEEKIFERKRFIPERLLPYGFRKTESGYQYETDFMDSAFHAILRITDAGELSSTVIDTMNNEEYIRLHAENCSGFVQSVRLAYEKLLTATADFCCVDILFASEQANRITERILNRYAVKPDFPWEQDAYQTSGVFRHADNGKWFALIMNVKRRLLLKNADDGAADIINLKIKSENGDALRKREGIYPAYHMNHVHWISVVLDDTLPDEEIMRLIEESFVLTQTKKVKRKDKLQSPRGKEY
ncbi:MAG: MmcQ/YjbR family DNA-binding protein [Treponema sp.]